VENFLIILLDLQAGHPGLVLDDKTSISKLLPQDSHEYSYIGIHRSRPVEISLVVVIILPRSPELKPLATIFLLVIKELLPFGIGLPRIGK